MFVPTKANVKLDNEVFSTHSHEISGWNILSIIFYSRDTHLVRINGDVRSDISTLVFKNGEHLEDFHSIIIRLQQEIILSVGIFSPKIILFQYMKALSNIYKNRAFNAPNMTYIITFSDDNGKSTVYKVG